MTSNLQTEIDERSREIHTDRYSMSINEVVSMYDAGDLEVHPEFQRIFRWSLEQQSRLVESVFLGIPIPPVFVAQRKDGVWDVVDGVQRLSTLLRFMGVLKRDDGSPDAPLPLAPGDYLSHLKGLLWAKNDEPSGAGLHELDEAQRRVFKRARLDFQIVQKESDEQAKYDLFQRLNSGTRLSEQEARNCLAVMLDASFATWLSELASYPAYDATVDISDRKEQEAYGVESVLRYLACTLTPVSDLLKMGDVGEFLTRRMRDFIADKSFDRTLERARFEFVFGEIDRALGSEAFKRYNSAQDRFTGKFSISAFEAIASGMARNESAWMALDADRRPARIRQGTIALWADDVFMRRSGGGKPAYLRIPYMAEAGERIFRDHAQS
jgi:hypothetical protein